MILLVWSSFLQVESIKVKKNNITIPLLLVAAQLWLSTNICALLILLIHIGSFLYVYLSIVSLLVAVFGKQIKLCDIRLSASL